MTLTSSLGTVNSTLGQGMILGGQFDSSSAPLAFPPLAVQGVVPQTALLTRQELEATHPSTAVRRELNRRGG